uniref:Uncharacterized protein n=1 Tax=Sphaerodactylus townsendi TaxID=933632 RepID=A0ACB8GB97_9SAUR
MTCVSDPSTIEQDQPLIQLDISHDMEIERDTTWLGDKILEDNLKESFALLEEKDQAKIIERLDILKGSLLVGSDQVSTNHLPPKKSPSETVKALINSSLKKQDQKETWVHESASLELQGYKAITIPAIKSKAKGKGKWGLAA